MLSHIRKCYAISWRMQSKIECCPQTSIMLKIMPGFFHYVPFNI